ncbi:helix-turn-helix domain-containing protein [Aliiruegeria lutimaris]|uniref:helix-turn-helix domain-containing protein n=1 Tax=Aliiruegeria lutimaris TaxID=571298 RepID=UPI003CC7AEA3
MGLTFAEIERRVLTACVARHGGSFAQAASELAISPSTIYRKRAGWEPDRQDGSGPRPLRRTVPGSTALPARARDRTGSGGATPARYGSGP